MENLSEQVEQLPTIKGHPDVETARDALASVRERLHDTEDKKAGVEAQIPELRSRVNDLHVEIAEGEATEEDREAA